MGIDFKDPKSLYEQIENDIKSKIASGKLNVGDQINSQSQLSKEYDVSLITVKKALSNLINEGVLFSRIGKGTYVARKSKTLDFSKNKSIGLVLRDLRHPFFSLIVHSVEEKAYELGYNILLSNSSGRLEKEESQIKHFENIGVEGLIIASMSLVYRATDNIIKLHKRKFPYVMVSYMEDPFIYYVGTDNENGAYLATEHLIKLGYKNIGYVNGGKGNLLGLLRMKGYEKALRAHKIKVNKKLIYTLDLLRDRFKSGYELGKNFKDLNPPPDALFFYSDLAALGFQQGIILSGLKVPDDIAVVGFDDIEMAKYAPSPLTTVQQDTNKIGALAIESVINRINGIKTPVRLILEPKLQIRSSCGVMLKMNKNKALAS
ncbi:MAG: GntR family transcriptional regulator [Ignavibacteriaceae bacterium]